MVVDGRIRARAEFELAIRLDRDVPLTWERNPPSAHSTTSVHRIGEYGASCSFVTVVAGMQFKQRAVAVG
jgi:hypothetical protein